MDFLLNGIASGDVATRLLRSRFDPNCLRPYSMTPDGPSYIVNAAGPSAVAQMIANAATLMYDEWKLVDKAVNKAKQGRLRAWEALRDANPYAVPRAMGKTTIHYQTQSDINPAQVSMDGLRRGQNDRPLYDSAGMPLPIIHKDFSVSARQLEESRNGQAAFDTSMVSLATRKVIEEVERFVVGTAAIYQYAGLAVYGYTNYPQRLTGELSDPAGGGWSPATLVDELLDARQDLMDNRYYGPFTVYNGTGWDKYLDSDYSNAKGDNTLRDRVAKIQGLKAPEMLEYLEPFDIVFVQQTEDVARAIVGMDITPVQWESSGGFEVMFKVLCILLPQLRCDFYDRTGIMHLSVPAPVTTTTTSTPTTTTTAP